MRISPISGSISYLSAPSIDLDDRRCRHGNRLHPARSIRVTSIREVQRLFHKALDDTSARERPRPELEECRRSGGWVWLDIADPQPAEIWELAAEFGLDPLSIEDVLDTTLLPKVDDHDRYLFVVLHGVVTAEETRLSTTELDFFIGSDFLLTVHTGPVFSVDWVADHITDTDYLTTAGPGGVAAMIAEFGIRRYLPLLEILDDRLDGLEAAALEGDPRVLSESQALRRDVVVLRRVLGPQRDVLARLSHVGFDLLGIPARRLFADVYDHHFRLVESLDSARTLLGSVLETYRGVVADRTNEIMKVLTVFSAILLPLSLIAGLWGMNFARVPGATWHDGFFWLLGSMGLLAAGLWVYFVRRGFVGGPRLRELPRAVGLSLVNLGSAPIRAISRQVGSSAAAVQAERESDSP